MLGMIMVTPKEAQAQVNCLPIDGINVSGVTLLKADFLRDLMGAFEGKCLGLRELDQVLERLTLSYVDRAYILSRAYFPEQDLSDRQLDIVVVEGQLESIQINGKQKPRQAAMVFPGLIGETVNLRDVEQGLDQIQTMPRTQAQMQFEPGRNPGDSVLSVSVAQPKPFELRYTTKNHGNSSTGLWLSGFEGDVGNVLGFNETITFSFNKSLDPSPFSFGYDGDHNLSGNLDVSVPYGRWTFGLSAGASRYNMSIPGAISPIAVNGWANNQGLTASYLFHRDKEVKTNFEIAVNRKDAVNYIQGVRIENSSRTLSNVRFTLGDNRPLWGGHMASSVFIEQGLHLFNAEDAASKPQGSPNAQYTLAGFEASYERQFQAFNKRFKWTSDLSGQFSNDVLYGGELFTIGGPSTVRGTRITLASGNSGLFWRNEVEYTISKPIAFGTKLGVYGGLDWGWVADNAAHSNVSGQAIGGILGTRLSHKNFDLDLSYQQVIHVSDALQKPEGEFFFEAVVKF
jgi:hemolysin activation/secretion protein